MHVYSPLCLADLFRYHDGVVLAEDHEDRHMLHFLIGQVKALKAAGGEVGFLEMFNKSPESMHILAEFNRTGVFSPEMREWVIKCEPRGRTVEDYALWFKALHAENIQIAPLDEIISSSSIRQIGNANTDWVKTVKATMQPQPRKYFMLVGKSHTHLASKYEYYESDDQAEGVDSMLKIPCVLFYPVVPSRRFPCGVPEQAEYKDTQNTYRMRVPMIQPQQQASRV